MLAPNEPRVDIERTVRQARGETHKKLVQIFSRQGAQEIQDAREARREEHLTMLMIVERECLDLSEAILQLSEKQELLATVMKGNMSLQKVAPEEFHWRIFQELKDLEEQQTKEALELL